MIEDLWYKNAVIYALNVDSFMDGNGDGCGDFEGLTRRLNYLESLGIDAIWIGPFQPRPTVTTATTSPISIPPTSDSAVMATTWSS